jgi:hypothetical protein
MMMQIPRLKAISLLAAWLFFSGCQGDGGRVSTQADMLVAAADVASFMDAGAPDMRVDASAGDSEPPPIGYAPPEYCGTCHQSHYEQWRGSMHAYATQDPVFIAMNTKGMAETEGRLGQFCVQCHAPVASLKEMLPVVVRDGRHVMDLDPTNPFVAHGIQCVTCHSIESVQGTQNAQLTLSEQTYFGPTGSEAAKAAHPMMKSALFSDPAQKSILCGSCHDVLNPNGARLEATFSEWYANAFNDPRNPDKHRTCQDCHMPVYRGQITIDGPEKDLHAHTFVGVDQALIPGFPGKVEQARLVRELLQDCAELEVRYNGLDENANAAVVVSVENINNGHNLPSGSTADRQVWVHLRVSDGAGNLVYESGMFDANGDLMDGVVGHSIDPDGDPELFAFGQFIYGANGEHVSFPWQAHSYTDNLIGPGQRKWRDYLIPLRLFEGRTIRVEAVLKYRTFPPFLIRNLVDDGLLNPDDMEAIPVIEMERVETEFTLR